MFRILIALLFSMPTFTAFSSDNPVCDASPKTYFGTNSFGDVGCFQYGEEDILVLRAGNKNSEINRWRSPYNNKYRIWNNSNHSVISLRTRAEFDSALVNFGNRAPNKDWCEIVQDPYTSWYPVSGSLPTSCGVHSYSAFRNCSACGMAEKPCPDTCPAPVEYQTITVDNGDCDDCTDTSIYYTDTGIEASAYAATCPIGESFEATNCEGKKEEFACETPTCTNPGVWEYQYCEGSTPSTRGSTTLFYRNWCGDSRQEEYICLGSADTGTNCCVRGDI